WPIQLHLAREPLPSQGRQVSDETLVPPVAAWLGKKRIFLSKMFLICSTQRLYSPSSRPPRGVRAGAQRWGGMRYLRAGLALPSRSGTPGLQTCWGNTAPRGRPPKSAKATDTAWRAEGRDASIARCVARKAQVRVSRTDIFGRTCEGTQVTRLFGAPSP